MPGTTLTSILALLLALLGGGDATGLPEAISAIEQAPAFAAVCGTGELCPQMQQLQALERVQERLREHQGEESPAYQAVTRAMEMIQARGEGSDPPMDEETMDTAGAAEALQKALETVEANTPEHANAADALAGALERVQERTQEQAQEGPQANLEEPQGPPDPMPQPPADRPEPQGPPDPMPEPPAEQPAPQGPPDPMPGPPAEAPHGPSGAGGRGPG